MNRDRLLSLTGVAFVVLLVGSFFVAGEPPDADDPVAEIIEHYVDNKDSIVIAVFMSAFAAISVVVFANYLRTLMRDTSASALILVGAGITAVGAGVDNTISLSLAEAAEDIDPAAVQALQALWDNDFVPIAIGIVIFIGSCGFSILRTGALPKWLGWFALLLAAIGLTPLGFAAFMGSALWVLITSVLLAVRAGGPSEPAAAPMGPPD